MAAADCYVSLHRSEGFGLTLAEAMALGKPVIATGYSGNLDFMTPETSYLVPWRYGVRFLWGAALTPQAHGGLNPTWHRRRPVHAQVYEDPSLARKVGERAKAFVLINHGVEARDLYDEQFAAAQRLLRRKRKSVAIAAGPLAARELPACRHCCQPAPRFFDAPSNHPRAARLPPALRLASAAVP